MSSSQGKRKVMGRIDLTNATESPSSPSIRAYTHVGNLSSPSPTPGVRKAKVDLSSIVPSAGSGNVPAKAVSTQPGIRAHVTAAPTALARSPLNGSASVNGNQASLSPSLHTGPVRATVLVGSDSRQSTRSPSPAGLSNRSGTMSPVHSSGQAPHVSTQQRPKARPVSTYGQEAVWSSASPRATPTSLSAKVTTVMNDAKPVRAHLRTQSSFPSTSGSASARGGSASPLVTAPPSRSRSPSPTLVKLQQHSLRRISHSSTASLGGSSVTSSSIGSYTKPYSVGNPAAINTTVTLNRPALASTSYFPGISTPSSLPLTPASGLNSPLQLQSPAVAGPGFPLASPTVAAPLSSPNALLSPAVELDAEALEAKTNRKILDLEITNRSLLAINSSLEVVKLQQAREIRDLKRHVREGRALGNRLGLASDVSVDLEDSSDNDDGEDEGDDEESDVELPLNTELEQAHQRCNHLIDAMVAQAREAILSKHDTERRPTGNRVLHPVEVDAMRQAAEEQGQQGGEAQEGTPTVGTIELDAEAGVPGRVLHDEDATT